MMRRVRRASLVACMTCPICNELLDDATTISECFHTFCRKCIFVKLIDEKVKCCPVCNIYLGCIPIEKLRDDHNLRGIRAKIFPFKRGKFSASEVEKSITLPVRRKERSLSSLGVNIPQVATQLGLIEWRAKATARKASTLPGLSPIIDEPKKAANDSKHYAENSSQHKRQNVSNVEPSDCTPDKNTEKDEEPSKDTSHLRKPLNRLVEDTNRTKVVKSGPQSSIKDKRINGTDNGVHMHKMMVREHPNKSNTNEDDGSAPISSLKVNARKRRGRKKKVVETSAQALIDTAGATCERNSPIWLALVPTIHRNGDSIAALPQPSPWYLRIKDGNLPVSFVQKYLVKKHNLASESEMEITCCDQTLSPTLALHNLVDLWTQSQQTEKVQANLGTSAKDFVVVLNYRIKAPAS